VRIAMSGYADMDMVTEAINRGAIYKFLTKPFDNEVLRQSIAKAFQQLEISLPHEQ
jgi:FixJ family two-component response regulator